jgi:hypothetical protein
MFKRAKACLARHPGVGVWSAMAWIVDEEDRLMRLHPSPLVSMSDAYFPPHRCVDLLVEQGGWFTGTTLIYRRDAVEEAGRFDRTYMGLADWFTAIRVASRYGATYSPAALAAIRKHRGSYLNASLADPVVLDDILQKLSDEGRRTAPQLFTPEFIRRTFNRFHFTSILETGAKTMQGIGRRTPGWTGRLLRLGERMLPGAWRLPRAAWAFLVLRPFDLWSMLWNRMLGWLFVRLRSRWPEGP